MPGSTLCAWRDCRAPTSRALNVSVPPGAKCITRRSNSPAGREYSPVFAWCFPGAGGKLDTAAPQAHEPGNRVCRTWPVLQKGMLWKSLPATLARKSPLWCRSDAAHGWDARKSTPATALRSRGEKMEKKFQT